MIREAGAFLILARFWRLSQALSRVAAQVPPLVVATADKRHVLSRASRIDWSASGSDRHQSNIASTVRGGSFGAVLALPDREQNNISLIDKSVVIPGGKLRSLARASVGTLRGLER